MVYEVFLHDFGEDCWKDSFYAASAMQRAGSLSWSSVLHI